MTAVLADPVDETRRILAAADALGVPLRAVGGVAIALRAQSVQRLHPPRTYHDIDLAAAAPRAPIERLLTDLGYVPARRFNTLNGAERLLFHDESDRRIDVFLDRIRMCHELSFRHRLERDALTLPLADLALTKLQIVELTVRDTQDLAALLADHELTEDDAGIAMRRIAEVCTNDWGWWKSVDDNLRRLVERWRAEAIGRPEAEAQVLGTAAARALVLRDRLIAAPKSTAWRLRAAVGARVRWYDEPEEVR
jgi:hypothetical protein